ncbi:MAG: 3-hydroxyacyl-ACP dehydratase FabZ family protein, partial [Planctomycetota bacterium]
TKADIEATIPHRAPFLWLDEVTEIDDTRIVAKKYLDAEIDVFKGHYPGHPIFPGVLQCEMCLQASAVLIARTQETAEGAVPVVARMNKVKFKRMVQPGETVDIEVVITERVKNAFFLTGKASVNGDLVTRLDFVTTEAPAAV